MQKILVSFLVVICATVSAMGGNSPPVVEARTLLSTDAAHAGSSVKLAVVAQVAPGFHINDHKPTLDYLIPTELKVEPTSQMTVGRVAYPKGEHKKFEFSETALSVYEGKVVIGAILNIKRSTSPGSYSMSGKLTYQACNERACLPPTSVPLSLVVKVVPRNVSLKRMNRDVFEKVQYD